MTLEEIMGKAVNVLDQAKQAVNLGIGIFDPNAGSTAPIHTTVPTQTTAIPLAELEGPPVSAANVGVQLDRYKIPILIGLGALLFLKGR